MRNVWLVIVLAACNKGGGADPASQVRGFVEAVAAGDFEKARSYLPDEAACNQAPADQVENCKDDAKRMRDAIPQLTDGVRTGTKVTKVERADVPGPDPTIVFWRVEIGGDDHPEFYTIDLGGKTYVAFLAPARPAN